MSKYIGTGYCKHCQEEVEVHLQDFGLGRYEYWGATVVDHEWVTVCHQCGEEMEDFDEIPSRDDIEPPNRYSEDD